MAQRVDHLRSGGGNETKLRQQFSSRPSPLIGLVLGIPLLILMALSLALAMGTAKPLPASADSSSVETGVVATEPASVRDENLEPAPAMEVAEPAPAVEPAPADATVVTEESAVSVVTEEPAAVTGEPVTGEPARATDQPAPAADEPAPATEPVFADTRHESESNDRSTPDEEAQLAAERIMLGVTGDAVDQCSNTGTVGGDTITCTVTVTNNCTYNAATPEQPTCETTVVTVTSCTGSAVCPTGTTQILTEPITTITQCNNAGSGGASTVTCTVTVTNNLTGFPVGSVIDSTVRQCQNTAAVGTRTCVATPPGNNREGDGGPGGQRVTQCNSSGGTGTLTCTVTAPTSQTTGLPTTIRQCNSSGTTGASTVTCTATITNNYIDSIPGEGDGSGDGDGDGPGDGDGEGPGDGDGEGPGGGGGGPGGGGGGGPAGGGGEGPGGGNDERGGGLDYGPGSDARGAGVSDTAHNSGISSGGTGESASSNVRTSDLPFTGFDIGIAALFGLFTLLFGAGLRRAVAQDWV